METMRFSKDGKVYTWQVKDGHVLTTVRIGNSWVANPTVQRLLDDGYEIVPAPEPQPTPVPEPYVPTYKELVQRYIREHGYESIDDEIAVVNNYMIDNVRYYDEWQAYQFVRNDAKNWANEQPHRDEVEQQEQEDSES